MGRPFAMLPLFVVVVCIPAGCNSSQSLSSRRPDVSAEIATRMGHPLADSSHSGGASIPPGVELTDGVTEDEAIALALWNNAAYQETLSQLGVSEAQLFDAGLLQDPQLTLLFPLGPKQFEFSVMQLVDGIWLRPIRVRAAELGLERVADQMVQNGLDVIRDVRLAHAGLLYAQQNAELADEAKKIRTEIAELAQKRLDAGDISELEANDSRVQSLIAKAASAQHTLGVTLARKRLLVLVGFAMRREEIIAVESETPVLPVRDENDLVDEALAMRPDLRAAEISVQELDERVRLARKQVLSLEAGVDANEKGTDGFEASPAARLTLPIFNGNRGKIAIAEAQLEQATRRYTSVRDQAVLDVWASYASARQAGVGLETVRDEIIPTLETAIGLARKNYLEGGASYFLVLQTTSQFLEARARAIQLSADFRRAVAELERSVGHRFMTGVRIDKPMKRKTNQPPPPPGT